MAKKYYPLLKFGFEEEPAVIENSLTATEPGSALDAMQGNVIDQRLIILENLYDGTDIFIGGNASDLNISNDGLDIGIATGQVGGSVTIGQNYGVNSPQINIFGGGSINPSISLDGVSANFGNYESDSHISGRNVYIYGDTGGGHLELNCLADAGIGYLRVSNGEGMQEADIDIDDQGNIGIYQGLGQYISIGTDGGLINIGSGVGGNIIIGSEYDVDSPTVQLLGKNVTFGNNGFGLNDYVYGDGYSALNLFVDETHGQPTLQFHGDCNIKADDGCYMFIESSTYLNLDSDVLCLSSNDVISFEVDSQDSMMIAEFDGNGLNFADSNGNIEYGNTISLSNSGLYGDYVSVTGRNVMMGSMWGDSMITCASGTVGETQFATVDIGEADIDNFGDWVKIKLHGSEETSTISTNANRIYIQKPDGTLASMSKEKFKTWLNN